MNATSSERRRFSEAAARCSLRKWAGSILLIAFRSTEFGATVSCRRPCTITRRLRIAPIGRGDQLSGTVILMDASPQQRGITLWLTGLPSAGKSTIAVGVAARFGTAGRRVQVLDGDEMRSHLTPDLGFSRADREENVRRIGFVARLLSRHGVVTLVPVIAPYAGSRAEVRALHAQAGVAYAEVFVATPVNVCADRDVKGLYARQRAGELRGLTGVDDPYEPPTRPDLMLATHRQTVTESVEAVCVYLSQRSSPA